MMNTYVGIFSSSGSTNYGLLSGQSHSQKLVSCPPRRWKGKGASATEEKSRVPSHPHPSPTLLQFSLKDAPAVLESRSVTVLTPLYGEDVIYSLRGLVGWDPRGKLSPSFEASSQGPVCHGE